MSYHWTIPEFSEIVTSETSRMQAFLFPFLYFQRQQILKSADNLVVFEG